MDEELFESLLKCWPDVWISINNDYRRDRVKCSHYVGWFTIERDKAGYTVVLEYMTSRVKELVSIG